VKSYSSRKNFYFCGVVTDNCVLKGVVDAFEHNFTPWLIADASASHDGPEAHEEGLLSLGASSALGRSSAKLMSPCQSSAPSRTPLCNRLGRLLVALARGGIMEG
jgi:isochorismate hydrolase